MVKDRSFKAPMAWVVGVFVECKYWPDLNSLRRKISSHLGIRNWARVDL